jgi:DNA-binding response OmpR family regulator
MDDSILLIEDDHDIRVAFRQTLEECGFKVHSAANGRDGLLLLSKFKPKLIVLDLGMPIMPGDEFLRTKDAIPDFNQIPVLVITCDKNRTEVFNQYPHLIKPVDLNEFVAKVTDCLKICETTS